MTIDDVVKKRTDLFNFFLNKDKKFNKEEILHKEFAVLSFSPNEEYIDFVKTPFDEICVDLSNYALVDAVEVYIKGIITDVDRQNFQTIIHIQNKENIASIVCRGATLYKYDDYFVVGEPVIVKCKVYSERLYLSFLIQLNNLNKFENELKYISGESYRIIDSVVNTSNAISYGVIVECSFVKTSNGRDMLRGTIYDGHSTRSFGSVVTQKFNPYVPTNVVAGDFIKFKRPTHDFFINQIEVVHL